MESIIKIQLPHESNTAPAYSGGVYFFNIRFPSDYELGITGKTIDLPATRGLINMKVQNLLSAIFSGSLFGCISDKKAEHLHASFEIIAERSDQTKTSQLVANQLQNLTSPELLLDLTQVLRVAFDQLPPIYIGLAWQQSLHDRLQQHLTGQTALLTNLKNFNLSFYDLFFSCLPVKLDRRSDLRDLEKTLQSILKPIFSIS